MQVGAVLRVCAETGEEEFRQGGGGPVVDTLNLSLNDFEIAPSPRLSVQPHSYQADTGVISSSRPLWNGIGGRPVEGKEAKHVAEHFTIVLKSLYADAPVGCYVQLSLPKFYSGNNFAPINLQESQTVIQRLERELWGIGIHTSLQTANMARLDLVRNIQTDEPFLAYPPLFRYLEASRQRQCEWDTEKQTATNSDLRQDSRNAASWL